MITNGQGDAGTSILTAVVLLLEDAAAAAWTEADTDDPSHAHVLGLGVHVVACQGLNLLNSTGVAAPTPAGPGPPGGDTDPVGLLRQAEALTRSLPIEGFPPGTSALVVAVCDLLRDGSA